MEMIPVDSSNISAIGYDSESATLKIEFIKGGAYEYYNVPEYEFNNLLNAGSKGQYANQHIYKVYTQSKV